MDALFERATKQKVRFKMSKGQITTEDLWELSLEDLNELAKALNKELKESEEESFISKPTRKSSVVKLKFEVVKRVIEVKMTEEEEAETRQKRANKRAQIAELIEKKQMQSLEGKSIEELMAELEAIG